MAGPLYVGINFFSYKSQGWSEVYPLTAVVSSIAVTALKNLAIDRLNMLPPAVTHLGGRVSDVYVRGDAYLVPSQGFGGYTGIGTPSVLPINTALQLRLQGQTAAIRSTRYLHGWWTSDVQNGLYNPEALMVTLMSNYTFDLQTLTGILTNPIVGGVRTPTISGLTQTPVIMPFVWTRKIGRPFGVHRGRRSAVR
jgi:hypothetical protein